MEVMRRSRGEEDEGGGVEGKDEGKGWWVEGKEKEGKGKRGVGGGRGGGVEGKGWGWVEWNEGNRRSREERRRGGGWRDEKEKKEKKMEKRKSKNSMEKKKIRMKNKKPHYIYTRYIPNKKVYITYRRISPLSLLSCTEGGRREIHDTLSEEEWKKERWIDSFVLLLHCENVWQAHSIKRDILSS